MDQILLLMEGKYKLFNMKKSLLITAGAGFIGFNFLKNQKLLIIMMLQLYIEKLLL